MAAGSETASPRALFEALVRMPLIYLLPIEVMVGLSALLILGTLAALILWTGWHVRRSQRSTPRGAPAT